MPIEGIAHINITVPPGSMAAAHAFYGGTLGLTSVPTPAGNSPEDLAWFDIGTSSSSHSGGGGAPVQQVHVAAREDPTYPPYVPSSSIPATPAPASTPADSGPRRPGQRLREAGESTRHPCFRVGGGQEALTDLRRRVWKHHVEGGQGAPRAADDPEGENSGQKGAEFPSRFFARDFAGNRLEFSLCL